MAMGPTRRAGALPRFAEPGIRWGVLRWMSSCAGDTLRNAPHQGLDISTDVSAVEK